MILLHARLYDREGTYHIVIENDRIKTISPVISALPSHDGQEIDLDGALVLPGFINSHDHLDFNFFPQLGKGGYENYRQWGPDIHQEHKELIVQVKNVPLSLRIAWGQYRNLLNGFTSVVNHGVPLSTSDGPGHVYQDVESLHSPGFEPGWQWKLNNPFRLGRTVVMHAGEGIDEMALDEVGELIRHNYFRRPVVAVHGVAMNSSQARHFKGLVWCPGSNYFLFGKTAPVAELFDYTNIVFGTDSTLTAPWNAWIHFRQALDSVSEKTLFQMLTSGAATLWNFKDRGVMAEGKLADLLIVDGKPDLFHHNPHDILGVISEGKFQMADYRLPNASTLLKNADMINVGNAVKYVPENLNQVMREVNRYYSFVNPLAYA